MDYGIMGDTASHREKKYRCIRRNRGRGGWRKTREVEEGKGDAQAEEGREVHKDWPRTHPMEGTVGLSEGGVFPSIIFRG